MDHGFQVTETQQLQTEAPEEIVKSPWIQRAMQPDLCGRAGRNDPFAKMKGLKNQIKKIEHDRTDLQMG